MSRGVKPLPPDERRVNKTLTFAADIWQMAQEKAASLGFAYRGRVSTAAYIESLIKRDNGIK